MHRGASPRWTFSCINTTQTQHNTTQQIKKEVITMKFKVKHLYSTYHYLPRSGDEMVGRIASGLYVRYKHIDTQDNLLDSCLEMANNIYTFKILHLYDYLQSEIMCKVRAKRFSRHVIRKQIFGI